MAVPADSTPQDETDSALLPGESVIASLQVEDGEFQMTAARILFKGSDETESVYSAARLRDITGVEISRRPRESRSAWWGGLGLVASIGVWQVSASQAVGTIAAAVVAIISLALLADYWFRPGGAILVFSTPGSSVRGMIEPAKVESARRFIAEFEQVRAYYIRSETYGPTAGYGSF